MDWFVLMIDIVIELNAKLEYFIKILVRITLTTCSTFSAKDLAIFDWAALPTVPKLAEENSRVAGIGISQLPGLWA